MAKRTKTVGSGITAETRAVYSGDDFAAFKRGMDRWSAARKEGGGDFGAVTLAVVKQCRAILDRALDDHFEEHSQEWFAEKILTYHDIAKRDIGDRDADSAARFAYLMGYVHCQAHMKGRWEPYTLSGLERANSLREAAARNNKERQRVQRAQWALWNEAAQEIWAVRPELSKSRVAQLVRSKLEAPESVDTISRRLTKVRKAR